MLTNGFLKIHKWWTSHYGTMMAFIYFVLAASSSPPTLVQLLSSLLLFTVGSIGIASLGQLLNDLGDIHQDMRSGAPNLLASQGISARLLIFLSVAIAAIKPWIWLPMAPVILLLLFLEIILFIIYSLPPLRLKGRGLLGLIADSLYAYVITNSVAILVFAKLASYIVPL